MEKEMSRLVEPSPMRGAIMVPWRLDGAGRPPNVGVMAEVGATLGTVLGAATPVEGFRRLVSRQSTGAATAGGSWAGVGVVQHQVHTVEVAGDNHDGRRRSWSSGPTGRHGAGGGMGTAGWLGQPGS